MRLERAMIPPWSQRIQIKMTHEASSITCETIAQSVANGDESSLPQELRKLLIIIEGNHVSGSFDYTIAQSIIQLQQIVYRVVAHALYGEGATVKNLTESDLEKYKLSFQVSPGCTEILTEILKFFRDLLNPIIKDMNPTQKLTLVGILCGLFLGYFTIDKVSEYYLAQQKSEAASNLSKEETKRIELILKHTANAGDEASTNFAKAAKGASNLTFGARTYSSEQLTNIQKRTPRTSTDWKTVDAAYVVLVLDKQKDDVLWATIKDIETGEIFKASYAIEDDDVYAIELQIHMAHSMLNGSAIKLKVNIGRKPGEEKVVKATILEFIDDSE